MAAFRGCRGFDSRSGYGWDGWPLDCLEGLPAIGREILGELRAFLLCVGEFPGRRHAVGVAGIVAEEQFRFVVGAVGIGVFARDELEAGGDVLFPAVGDEFTGGGAEAGAEWVVGKFLEAFGVLVI